MAPITSTKEVNTGIDKKNREKISRHLRSYLADTYAVYLKTQNYHWNVTGPLFESLHKMFEEQYQELAKAADTIAERIRALGFKSPGTFPEFAKLTGIPDGNSDASDDVMVRNLIEDHEKVARSARQGFELAEKGKDQATADLLTERMEAHEKFAWMLKSVISK